MKTPDLRIKRSTEAFICWFEKKRIAVAAYYRYRQVLEGHVNRDGDSAKSTMALLDCQLHRTQYHETLWQ